MKIDRRVIAALALMLVGAAARAQWTQSVLTLDSLPTSFLEFNSVTLNNAGGFAVATTSATGGNEGYVLNGGRWDKFDSGVFTVNGMNDAGQIVGDRVNAGVFGGAAIWQAGQPVKDFGILPGYADSSAQAINSAGTVVGASGYYAGLGATSQANYGAGPVKALPNDAGSAAFDINNQSVIVGTAAVPGQAGQTGVYTVANGAVTFIDQANSATVPYFNVARINDSGDISYNAIFAGGILFEEARLRRANGSFQALSAAGYANSRALQISARGDVLGLVWNVVDAATFTVESRLVIWRGGVAEFIGASNEFDATVPASRVAMNDLGQVLALRGSLGSYELVLLTPLPEPASWALMSAGVVGLMVFAGRRRTRAVAPT